MLCCCSERADLTPEDRQGLELQVQQRQQDLATLEQLLSAQQSLFEQQQQQQLQLQLQARMLQQQQQQHAQEQMLAYQQQLPAGASGHHQQLLATAPSTAADGGGGWPVTITTVAPGPSPGHLFRSQAQPFASFLPHHHGSAASALVSGWGWRAVYGCMCCCYCCCCYCCYYLCAYRTGLCPSMEEESMHQVLAAL